MIHLLVVSEGLRDEQTVPRLVEGVLGVSVQPQFKRLDEFRVGGFARKLQFAVLEAEELGIKGVVATVDNDVRSRQGEKLEGLAKGREAAQVKSPGIAVAIGEANPHSEAWLLDDAQAVREALQLPTKIDIPPVKGLTYPKTTL